MDQPPPHPNHPFSFSFPPQNPNPTAIVDLPTTLSSLKDLIHLSNKAVHSVSDLLHDGDGDEELIGCPFSPQHRMGASSLFLHSLRCPFSPYSSFDLHPLLHSLHYPHTLKPSSHPSFLRTLTHSTSPLCFSLDHYLDPTANFFYRDCPAAVPSSSSSAAAHDLMLSLPRVLSLECANFVGDGDLSVVSRDVIGISPSGFWMLRNEVEAWRDYPCVYSYNALPAVLGLRAVKGCDFGRWVIANSPKYGVVIDVHVRDHIVVLVRLCFKAIVREAAGLLEQNVEVDMRSSSVSCPVMVEVLMWVASQFSILYGELNGKFFAINLLKHCILESASRLLMFSSEENKTRLPIPKEGLQNLDDGTSGVKERLGRSLECQIEGVVNVNVTSEMIYVSQVAAAVAALHERSLLEDKIKGFIAFQSLPKYQRLIEHANVTKKADEVRKSCPDYKPIIEHDGLPQQQQTDEERSRTKTIEEKLAEERDYKRRRMSYRGKKLKRSTAEVMRDIIEKYMDEIKQAGGIGCFVKGGAEEGKFRSESSASDISLRNSNHVLTGATGGSANYQKNQPGLDYAIKTTEYEDVPVKDYEQSRQGYYRQHEHLEDRRSYSRKENDREYYSRSPERSRSYGRSHGQSSRRKQDDVITRTRHHEAKRSNDYDRRSSSISNYMNNSNATKTVQKSEDTDRERRNTYRHNGSDSLVHNVFEDRYDPTESHDVDEDEVPYGNPHNRSDRLNDGEFHEQLSNYSANEQYPGYRKKSK